MATRTETDIKLYTSAELQEMQDNSHSGSATDSKGNIQAVLTAITTLTKAAAQANRDYVDILWSSIKTGSYTNKILGWIDLSAENSLDEHKFGVADTIWTVDIGNRITESGCSWIFVYNRDSEQPCGLRISWWEDDPNKDDDNPIDVAWENNPYIILPSNKYTFPSATEVDTVVVQPNIVHVNKDLINSIFSSINYSIQTAAKNGQVEVHIPWNLLGNAIEVQKMFVTTGDIGGIAGNEPSLVHKAFAFGERTEGHYPKATNRSFTIDDFDPMEMGFFNDTTYEENDYVTFAPTQQFTLYQILTEVLGYGVCYAAGVDTTKNGEAYCDGIYITWDKEHSYVTNISMAQYSANARYNKAVLDYQNALTTVLSWNDGVVPTLDSYIAANKKNNTAWLKTFVDLTTSKMNTAFAKGDRVISILWSEISSSYADEVKRAWQNGACQYEGHIEAPVPNGHDLGEGSQTSLGSAYNQIMNADYYYAGSTSPHTYFYGYIRYKKDTDGNTGGGGGSSSTTIEDIYYEESIGLAITLYGYVPSSPQSGNNADAQAADAIRGMQYEWKAKDDPSKKK